MVPAYWRRQKERYGLVGDRNVTTGEVSFPAGINRPKYNPETGTLIDNTPIKIEDNKLTAVKCESLVKTQ